MMMLSLNDIKRIEKLGYKKDEFVVKKDGFYQLKNKNHRCVFHNGTSCIIYPNRPIGCQLYPVIYDMDNKKAVLDTDCPYSSLFKITDEKQKKLLLPVFATP